jgi:hypothetical protein
MRSHALVLGIVAALAGAACGWLDDRPEPIEGEPYTASAQSSTPSFTTAHSSFGAAVNDYFSVPPTGTQPIDFPHNIHIEKGLTCTEYCHEAATTGPQAGLPSVNTCLICHAAIATDRPRIQQITQMQEQGLDLEWRRVYRYAPSAHVRFSHAPHLRAGVDCATCHGDIAHQTVAQRNVNLNMGYCVNCHRQKNASNDCLICHY